MRALEVLAGRYRKTRVGGKGWGGDAQTWVRTRQPLESGAEECGQRDGWNARDPAFEGGNTQVNNGEAGSRAKLNTARSGAAFWQLRSTRWPGWVLGQSAQAQAASWLLQAAFWLLLCWGRRQQGPAREEGAALRVQMLRRSCRQGRPLLWRGSRRAGQRAGGWAWAWSRRASASCWGAHSPASCRRRCRCPASCRG